MLKSFLLEFTKVQLTVASNLSELHKAHVLHHWHLVGILMISQEVKCVGAITVANCHLCNHPFRNLYEIMKSGDEEKALFAAVTRKHQIEADGVIGGIGSGAAVTMLRDALLSTALYVCLACAARVLGARYQCREAWESVYTTRPTTAAIPIPVALAGVITGVTPEREPIFAGSMLVTSHGPMATDSAPRRSERVTQQPDRLLYVVELYVAPTAPLRNVACKRKAVTAEMLAIGLHPDGKQMLLKRVSASRALRLLKQFRQGYCPTIGKKLSICDPVPPTLRTEVRIEVHQHIVNLPWLQVGQQGTITSVRKDVIYVTLDAFPVPLQVTTVLTATATLLAIYTGPYLIPPPPPTQHAKVHLSVEQLASVRGICETCMWRVHEIAPSATSTQLVVHALLADAPARRGGNLSNSCTQFPLETVIQLLKEAGVDLPADASASASGNPSEAALSDMDNLDPVNMPATFDYEGDETSWQQGLPPEEVGPQLSGLELSESDSDNSSASILGVCLYGFDGDTWISDAEGAQDDMQVCAAAGDNNRGEIPWRTIGGIQGAALGDNNEGQGGTEGGVSVGGDRAAGGGVTLTKEEKRKLTSRMKKQSPSAKTTHGRKDDGNHGQARDARRLAKDS